MPANSTTTIAIEASFWCYRCSRLRQPRAEGEPIVGCTRCGTSAVAIEPIVGVVDAGAFLHACHPDAGLLRTPAPSSLPTVTIRSAGRDCAVCMEELTPGAAAAVITSCEHAYHPSCIAPWIEARGTCPLCRAPVAGGGAGDDRDGLVTCRLSGGRIGLGRRVAGRIFGVRILDEDGKVVVRRSVLRGFKGVLSTAGAFVCRALR
ncbi:unnamed protein product [Urochloa humidicola]